MRNLFFILISFIPSVAFSQLSFPPYNISGQAASSGTFGYYSSSIAAPQSGYPNDAYSGTSTITYTASQSISLLPGFSAGGYSSSGYFLGVIGSGPVSNAQIMNADTPVHQYEKLEIGLNINPVYIAPINLFIANPTNPYSAENLTGYTIWDPINNPNGELDPYDPDQVTIQAYFISSSSGYPRYGYYQEDAGPTSTTYTITPDQNFPFRIRFAPPDVGTCYAEILLYINGVLAPGPQPLIINFNVVPSTNQGDIEVSPTYTKSTEFDTLNAHDGIVNYPNPFTSQTTIEFSLKNDSPISLYVIDTKGNRIVNIVSNQTFNKGGHVLSFNGTFLSSGVYYCILESNSGMKKVEMVKEK